MNFNYGSPPPRVGSSIYLPPPTPGDERTYITTDGTHTTGSQRNIDPRFNLPYDSNADFFINASQESMMFFKLLQGKDDETVPLFSLELHLSLTGPGELTSKMGQKLQRLKKGRKDAEEFALGLQLHAEKEMRPWRDKAGIARTFLNGMEQDGAVGSDVLVEFFNHIIGRYRVPLPSKFLRNSFYVRFFLEKGLSDDPSNPDSIKEVTLNYLSERLAVSGAEIEIMDHVTSSNLLKLFHELGLYDNPAYKDYVTTSKRNRYLDDGFSADKIYVDGGLVLAQKRTLLKICLGLPFVPGNGYTHFKPNREKGSDGWTKSTEVERRTEMQNKIAAGWLDIKKLAQKNYMDTLLDFKAACLRDVAASPADDAFIEQFLKAAVRPDFGTLEAQIDKLSNKPIDMAMAPLATEGNNEVEA